MTRQQIEAAVRANAPSNRANGVAVERIPGWYLAGKAPAHVTPGTRLLEGQYVSNLGRVEPWRAHYDQYGRMIARTDFNAGNRAEGIPDVHHHIIEYSAQYPLGRELPTHFPGEYVPR